MVPEILIVGDDVRRGSLVRRIGALGYAVDGVQPPGLDARLTAGPPPSAIMVCAVGADAAALMAQLRRSRHGAAIPVTLCGRLGGAIRDLADVLDLGADHFLEEPISDAALAQALDALAGAPMVSEVEPVHVSEASDAGAPPSRTEVISDAGVDARPSTPGSVVSHPDRRHRDPSIGQLNRTLDMLEEKMRARGGEHAPGDSADDLELSMLGLDATPDVGDDHGHDDPADSRVAARVRPRPAAVGRESTLLLENGQTGVVDPPTAGTEGSGSWRDFSSGRVAFDEVHERSSRVLHDRPRRTTPLTVDARGELVRVEVPRLIWKLHRAHFTGRLDLRRGRVEKRIWFDGGRIDFARSNIGYDRLIDGLLRRGLLTRDQYAAARRLAAKEPRRAGQLLVESGFLKDSELTSAIREHLQRIVDSTFPWNEGSWELLESERCDEPVRLDRHATAVLLEGIVHRMEGSQLWALLGGPRQHPLFRASVAQDRRGALVEELALSAEDETTLEGLTGRVDLGTLTSRRGAEEQRVLALVYALHVMELVELSAEAPPVEREPADPAELDRNRVLDRLRLARESDYFAVLSLARNAVAVDARRALNSLSKTFEQSALDPTVVVELAAELDELRVALREAASILADDDLRNAYLAHLEAQ